MPWIFDNGAVNLDLLRLVHTPMATSTVYTKGIDTRKRKLGDDQPDKSGKPKRRAKGKGKGKKDAGEDQGDNDKGDKGGKGGKGKNSSEQVSDERTDRWKLVLGSNPTTISRTGPVVPVEEDNEVLSTVPEPDAVMDDKEHDLIWQPCMDTTFAGPEDDESLFRPSLWLDDMVASAARVVEFEIGAKQEHLPSSMTPNIVSCIKGVYYSMALEFAWSRKIIIDSKEHRTWSQVRPSLQELIHKTFAEFKQGNTATLGMNDGSGNGSASASSSHQPQGLHQPSPLGRLLAAAQSSSPASAAEIPEDSAKDKSGAGANKTDDANQARLIRVVGGNQTVLTIVTVVTVVLQSSLRCNGPQQFERPLPMQSERFSISKRLEF